MSISERITGTIEDWRKLWGQALYNFLTSVISWGLELILDIIGKAAAPKLKPLVDMLEATGEVPPELQPILDELKSPTGQVGALFAQSAGSALIGGAIGKIIDAILLPIAYAVGSVTRNAEIAEVQMLTLWLRDKWTPEQLDKKLSWLGVPKDNVEWLKELTQVRLDPMSWITAFRRKYPDFTKIESDLKHQGWDDDRIAALKFITEVYPTPRDYVGFLAHEVFEPDMIAKYGLLSEWDKIDKEPAKKIGLQEDILKLYWMDHWEHPEWGTIRELRHRDQINDQDVRDWFRLVEIPEYWRPKMLEVLWGLPNRIEIRMMARYLDMSKEEIEALLKKAGLHEDFRSDAADFMMIMGLTGYWAAMLSKGWLSPAELKEDIDARGFKPITAERIYKRLVKAEKPEREAAERELTKSDIYKGVKKEVISWAEGVELLIDLGYDEEEADYILFINVPVEETVTEVKRRELTKADILKGLKAEVITEAEASTMLIGLRYTPDDAALLLKIYKALLKPPPEPREREASKADIVAAVKKGLITPEEAYLMLLDLDFTPEAAEFILMVKAEVSPFSPISYAEFKDLTHKYRVAIGMEARAMPEELKKAADEVVRLTSEVEALEESIKEEKAGLIEGEVLPEETTARLTELEVTRNRAISELERVKSEYDRLVAEWRHGLP